MKANLLMSLSGCIAGTVGVLVTSMEAQQGQPGSAPGGTPSKQPAPKNPTPRPASPTPQPANPTPSPANPAPPGNNQPDQTQPAPTQPGQKTPMERQPGRTPLNRQPGASSDSPRFVSLADPTMEPRFRESASRLMKLERGMAERNQRLVQRLGALRQLPPERQSGATLDLLQDILQENAQLQAYLAQSRTLITGDLSDSSEQAQPDTSQPNANGPIPDQPAPNPPTPAPAPSNPPR